MSKTQRTERNEQIVERFLIESHGNRIAETWLQPDSVTLLQQLGAMPEPEAA